MRICGIEPESIVDGPGFRYVVFVQGCPHHCPGCHNPESWSFDDGFDMSVDDIYKEIISNPYLSGVTYSGGEPFEQVEELLELSKKLEDMHLMSYSGYTYEELLARNDEATNELLDRLDILVDGRYVEKLRNLSLQYRGSENQRVIDLKKTRETGEIVLYTSEFDDI